MLDIPVHPTHDITLERRQQSLPVTFEGKRAGFVQTIDFRLSKPAAECSAHEPLQLNPASRAHVHEVPDAGVNLVGSYSRTLKLGELQPGPVTYRDMPLDRAQPLAWMALGGTGDVGSYIALGLTQADEQKNRRL